MSRSRREDDAPILKGTLKNPEGAGHALQPLLRETRGLESPHTGPFLFWKKEKPDVPLQMQVNFCFFFLCLIALFLCICYNFFLLAIRYK